MHEWLTVIIVLLIIGVLLDGIRRMRQARRNSLHMTLESKYSSDERNPIERSLTDPTEKSKAEQKKLDLEESVPMLMDSVTPIGPENAAGNDRASHVQNNGSDTRDDNIQTIPSAAIETGMAETGGVAPDIRETFIREAPSEPTLGPMSDPTSNRDGMDLGQNGAKSFDKRVEPKLAPAPDIGKTRETPVKKSSSPTEKPPPRKRDKQLEEVFILHIEAVDGNYFQGRNLMDVILDQGFRHGAMNIFHRHTNKNGEGTVLYSMVNMIAPGAFDLATFKDLSTPGVSLFMRLPMDGYDSMDAFNRMLATAKRIAGELGGEVKDDRHSVMTRQTIEHYRDRIRNFSRKQQLLERG